MVQRNTSFMASFMVFILIVIFIFHVSGDNTFTLNQIGVTVNNPLSYFTTASFYYTAPPAFYSDMIWDFSYHQSSEQPTIGVGDFQMAKVAACFDDTGPFDTSQDPGSFPECDIASISFSCTGFRCTMTSYTPLATGTLIALTNPIRVGGFSTTVNFVGVMPTSNQMYFSLAISNIPWGSDQVIGPIRFFDASTRTVQVPPPKSPSKIHTIPDSTGGIVAQVLTIDLGPYFLLPTPTNLIIPDFCLVIEDIFPDKGTLKLSYRDTSSNFRSLSKEINLKLTTLLYDRTVSCLPLSFNSDFSEFDHNFRPTLILSLPLQTIQTSSDVPFSFFFSNFWGSQLITPGSTVSTLTMQHKLLTDLSMITYVDEVKSDAQPNKPLSLASTAKLPNISRSQFTFSITSLAENHKEFFGFLYANIKLCYYQDSTSTVYNCDYNDMRDSATPISMTLDQLSTNPVSLTGISATAVTPSDYNFFLIEFYESKASPDTLFSIRTNSFSTLLSCTDVNDCSGNGVCIDTNTCQCTGGWLSRNCAQSYEVTMELITTGGTVLLSDTISTSSSQHTTPPPTSPVISTALPDLFISFKSFNFNDEILELYGQHNIQVDIVHYISPTSTKYVVIWSSDLYPFNQTEFHISRTPLTILEYSNLFVLLTLKSPTSIKVIQFTTWNILGVQCDPDCGGNGACVSGKCVCKNSLFSGPTCTPSSWCEDSCNQDGSTGCSVTATGMPKCDCAPGFSGSGCQYSEACITSSQPRCGSHGVLVPQPILLGTFSDINELGTVECSTDRSAVCECFELWRGSRCNNCPIVCMNGGKVALGKCSTCQCPTGYTHDLNDTVGLCGCQIKKASLHFSQSSTFLVQFASLLAKYGITAEQQEYQQLYNSPESLFLFLSSEQHAALTLEERATFSTFSRLVTAVKASFIHHLQITETKIRVNIKRSVNGEGTQFELIMVHNCPSDSPRLDDEKLFKAWGNYVNNIAPISIEFEFEELFNQEGDNTVTPQDPEPIPDPTIDPLEGNNASQYQYFAGVVIMALGFFFVG